VTRLTKSDIERNLLKGQPVVWQDSDKNKTTLMLDDPRERRLFAFLLNTDVRRPTELSESFVRGLATAFEGTDDPASAIAAATSSESNVGPWRLRSIETEGFGGLNIWAGPAFHFDFDKESILIEGPNGSGKSSLLGAILWALSGERPRDQADGHAHESKAVFGSDDRPAGSWPPIACYPLSARDLKSLPHVRVRLEFEDPQGEVAAVERMLDGDKLTASVDPRFQMPSILLEAGLLMPARLPRIRFNEGSGRLKHAVQKLTGLDDLVAIGALVDGLCHKGREYLSYKRKDLSEARSAFAKAIGEARRALGTVKIAVPEFTHAETLDASSQMAAFGRSLSDRASELTQVVSNDLAEGLTLANSTVQYQVISAIEAAKDETRPGLEGLPSWQSLQSITLALDGEAARRVSDAVANARRRAEEAIDLLNTSSKDSKFQLKVLAARWHVQHESGTVENCPLCDHNLASHPSLAQELEMLRSAGDAAARTFDDNLNAISAELESSLPALIRRNGPEILSLEPRDTIMKDLRARFVTKDRYVKVLVKFRMLVEAALSTSPPGEIAVVPAPTGTDILKTLDERIVVIERLLGLADWFRAHSRKWSEWWDNLAGVQTGGADSDHKEVGTPEAKAPERLWAHLLRLSDALATAEPYRKAAEAMRTAWKQGKTAAAIEKELTCREAIAKSLTPLKDLGQLSGSIAREAIEELSGRTATLLKQIHLTEKLQFTDARLQRKEGFVVRGEFVPNLTIDATLVANSSWLRAVLWAFLFALREEAVGQLGSDPFPLLVFDDPQSTFDSEHRHRWAKYIASLQNGPSKVQIVLATYDENFLELIKVAGVTGRQAMIAAAGEELGHVGVLEGDSLARKWSETQACKTPKAGREYIGKVREYVEGLLRLMLRGQAAAVMAVGSGFVVGKSRDRIERLNAQGIAPWNLEEFKNLVNTLQKDNSCIKHMEIAHHASGSHLGMAEAEDVEANWRKELGPALNRSFRLARDHFTLHGGLTALHGPPPTIALPEGYQIKVRQIPLLVLGRAAALSDGRVADGRFDFDEFSAPKNKKITLAQHFAYRLTVPTLEPVARPGDMLVVKESGEPSAKSLVVALSDDRIFARRFEIAEKHSDIAVLTAQAINPRRIAPPVIALKSTIQMHKIIGVLYEDASWNASLQTEMEVCECVGETVFADLISNALGLVEVLGQSAEPYALDRQYLIVKKELVDKDALKTLEGKPIIAADSNDNYYFKRLRIASDRIVLESLDSGGDYGPVVLSLPGNGENSLTRIWPVAGVLFELPK